MKKLLIPILVVLGICALAAIIWFVGPLIGFGDSAPLEPVWIRLVLILFVVVLIGGIYGWRWWRARRAAKALEEGLTVSEDGVADSQVLSERMGQALQTLRSATGRRDYLYALPWYIIIGPPNTGKTTALLKSGIKFPLASTEGGGPIAGVGGTRYCDWWFTDEAVLIDTAGRYTTQDSDANADKKSWLSFLALLKKFRPKQPINGVIVAISLQDLMQLSSAELAAHSAAIRKRLVEVHQELKVDFPVYALFTKADLVAGFNEYFGNFTEGRRRKVWGATFQTEDRKKNMIGAVPGEFDLLVKRLTEELPDRLQEEPDAISRIGIFGFPSQFAMLKDKVSDFLRQIFEPNRYQVNANLRGFYFSSGTQEGTPIDQVLGALDRGFGTSAGPRQLSGAGKSYFLHDLITSVIFSETGWVSLDIGAIRRSAVLRYGAMGALGLAGIVMLGLWGWSYASNAALIADTDKFVSDYRVTANSLITAPTVSDSDVMSVLPALDLIRNNPVGYAHIGEPAPIGETFGLSQRGELVAASEVTYQQALERLLRSRLILRVESQLQDSLNNPIRAYEALKVYMMLGGKAPKTQVDYIVAWMKQDWEDRYPGPNNSAARDDLEQHLRAMLALDADKPPAFELNGLLIDDAQRTLTRLTLSDQAYEYLKSLAPTAPIDNFNVASRAGPEAATVFETVDGSDFSALTVPALYTYSGFHDYFLPELASIADKLKSEQWVRGQVGQAMVTDDQFRQLGPKLLALYSTDFVAAWSSVLNNIKLKTLPGEKPDYTILSVASNKASSPIKALVEAIAEETTLTREEPAPPPPSAGAVAGAAGDVTALATQQASANTSGLLRIGIDLGLQKSAARPGAASPDQQVPGANIEAQFSNYAALTAGQPPMLDGILDSLDEIYRNLVVAALTPSQSAQATAAINLQLASLSTDASRVPDPLQRMLNKAVTDLQGDAASTSRAQLNQALASSVTQLCEQLTSNLYPFSPGSQRDLPMADFSRLFAPNGVMDRFFADNLAPLADMSGQVWTWKTDTALGRDLSNSALREFQRAAQIRDAFFPPGASAPQVTLTISYLSLNAAAQMALLSINGQVIQTQQVGSVPVTMQWPGSMGTGEVTITLQPDMPGRESSVTVQGPWALMRLLNRGSVSRSGNTLHVQFVIGGRDVAYSIQVGTIFNPLFLPALSEFSCPTGF